MSEFFVRKAQPSDEDEINKIFSGARAYMSSLGNPQWQDGHPSAAFIKSSTARGELFVVCRENRIAAVFSEVESDKYYDAADIWACSGKYLAVHTVAVSQDFRGCGCARFILSYAENVARSLGAHSLRLDTHELNVPMRSLLTSCGFCLRGAISVREQPRIAYEKPLI